MPPDCLSALCVLIIYNISGIVEDHNQSDRIVWYVKPNIRVKKQLVKFVSLTVYYYLCRSKEEDINR